jgi:hypothetical protein
MGSGSALCGTAALSKRNELVPLRTRYPAGAVRSRPSNGRGHRMAGSFFRLKHEDGTPADPPTLHTAVPNWSPSDTIPLGRETLRVVEVRDESDGPVLVVEHPRRAPT